jgi:hypothetical protein
MANVGPDSETRTKAMDLILIEICRKYKEKQDLNFSQEELHDLLKGYRTIYLMKIFGIYLGDLNLSVLTITLI